MYQAIDVMGFAGGFTLGVVQSGFELVGKRELPGGFGVKNCEANRALLGDTWRAEVGTPESWSAPQAQLVFGNPPCSGFSVMSAKHFRGADSKINHCMWTFARFAARVRPEIAVFESVQAARNRPDGHALMRTLRDLVESETGLSYHLYHVKHNAYSVGGCAERKRYFWLISRIPFGIEPPTFDRYPTLWDAIGDLSGLQGTWSAQPYGNPGSWWADPRRSSSGSVDGHVWADNPLTRRTRDLMIGTTWNQGEYLATVARRHYEEHGKLPDSWRGVERKVVESDFTLGFNTPTRWRADAPARVITGAGPVLALHPTENRNLSHREIARIMGFPDDWLIDPLKNTTGLGLTWGKGITVDCGRWIAEWIHRALDGSPGQHVGVEVGDREFDIDVTHAWKAGWYSQTRRVKTSPTRGTTMSETPEGAETEATEPRTSAGRPRPTATLELDEKTFEYLTEAKTTKEVEVALELTSAKAYLSLHRLRKEGRIASERRDGKPVWYRPDLLPAAV